MAELLQFALIAFTSIFVLVDPFAAIPTFLVLTADADRTRRRRTAVHAAWTCVTVLAVFGIAGNFIFNMLGITLPAFKIAGGIILGLIGLDMVQARRSPTKETAGDTEESLEKEEIGIIPLGIPMLAGPGSISTVMVLVSQAPDWRHSAIIFSAIAFTAITSYIVLAAAEQVRRFLGETGIRILTRMMGLLLTAIAVQFVLNGLKDVGVVR